MLGLTLTITVGNFKLIKTSYISISTTTRPFHKITMIDTAGVFHNYLYIFIIIFHND